MDGDQNHKPLRGSSRTVRNAALVGTVPDWAQASDRLRLGGHGHQATRKSQDNDGPLSLLSGLLTVQSVAAVLNVSVKTVRRLISRGELQIVRIGRNIRIKPDILKALIDWRSR